MSGVYIYGNSKLIIMEFSSLFICGSISGMATACLVQPLDVIKTNVLTTNQPMTISKSFEFVYQRYGLSGFWRGIQPSAYKAFIGSGISLTLLHTMRTSFPQSNSKFGQILHDALIAIVSRAITSISLSPLSVIKVRMEAPQANPYNSVWDGMIHIYKEEGYRGYYRGIGPALLRDLPYSGLAYSFYNQYRKVLGKITENSDAVAMISGGLAGFTATIITQPFDIIKTRNQFSHVAGEQAYKYKNILHAIRTIYSTEGIAGFATGLNIRLIERSLAFASVWFIYENLIRKRATYLEKNYVKNQEA